MRKIACAGLFLFIALPSFGSTHKYQYPMPCNTLWRAVKDTIRNSGEYAIVFVDSNEMTASFSIGTGQGLRIATAVLDGDGNSCQMQVQTPYHIAFTDDAGDFKKRVDERLSQAPKPQPTQ